MSRSLAFGALLIHDSSDQTMRLLDLLHALRFVQLSGDDSNC